MPIITKFRFNLGYLFIALLLFIIEILIAKYFSGWVRSYLGDVLVIILIYSTIMAFIELNKKLVVLLTLILAFTIEFSQYFKLAEVLGFEKGSIAKVVLGNTFSVEDLVCYVVGGFIILIIEGVYLKRTFLKSERY